MISIVWSAAESTIQRRIPGWIRLVYNESSLRDDEFEMSLVYRNLANGSVGPAQVLKNRADVDGLFAAGRLASWRILSGAILRSFITICLQWRPNGGNTNLAGVFSLKHSGLTDQPGESSASRWHGRYGTGLDLDEDGFPYQDENGQVVEDAVKAFGVLMMRRCRTLCSPGV